MFGFFRKKVKDLPQIDGVKMSNESIAAPTDTVINEKPMICTFDLDSDAFGLLVANSFSCVDGSLGALMRVPNAQRDSKHLLRPNHSIPENLHEFDIAIVDMARKSPIPYDSAEHLDFGNVAGSETFALLSRFPQQIFDFKPLGVHKFSARVNSFLSKNSILIVFADEGSSVNYELVRITSSGNSVCESFTHSNMNVYEGFPNFTNKVGSKLKATDRDIGITDLLLKYMQGGEYRVIFGHPTRWDQKKHKSVPKETFTPLAFNEVGEIVSYAHDVAKGLVLVFPQVKNKGKFLCELFNGHLAEHFPDIFPYSGQFGWLDDGSYPLPGELELLESRARLEEKYLDDVSQNQEALIAIKEDHKFLRELLTETGEKLVSAIATYLKWLGFDSVANMDDSDNDTLEEDLQVDCGDKLLVIEVKGVGGTSTDKACSQISKIKFRRAEQRGRFDVYGLYIVNHQRYVAPKSRKNPPFTEHQINDARLDKRGLLTTYDLYRAYFLILGGVLDKGFVKDKLFDFGVIDFYPSNMVSLGQPSELLKNGRVLILQLKDVCLAVGMRLVAKKGDSYSVHEIQSLQIEGVDVPTVSSGEVGVMLDIGVPNRSEILSWGEGNVIQV